MKKVLAAVMAVAMATSMSAVAFAVDYQNGDVNYGSATGSNASNSDDTLIPGSEKKYDVRVGTVELRDGEMVDFSTGALAYLMDNNFISASTVVTSGKDKLDSIPTIKIVGDTAQLKVKFKHTYDTKDVTAKIRPRFTAKKDIYWSGIYSYTVSYKTDAGDTMYVIGTVGFDADGEVDSFTEAANTKKDGSKQAAVFSADQAEALERFFDNGGVTNYKANSTVATEVAIPSFTTDSKKGTLIMKKGDTITCPEFELTAEYLDVDDYGDTLTVTPKEVSDGYVVARGEDLYDNSGSSDKVTIYFGSTGDVAALNFKVSSAQKDLNLFYKTDEIEDVTNAYDDIDFEFITFYAQNSGANVLTNTGSMTFNAIGGKNTTIYEWNGKTLTELNSKYDFVDDTVTVDGIKRLTTFVVSEKKLEAKVEETEAPATETQAPPVTEPITAPEPSAPADNNENPNTGAL